MFVANGVFRAEKRLFVFAEKRFFLKLVAKLLVPIGGDYRYNLTKDL